MLKKMCKVIILGIAIVCALGPTSAVEYKSTDEVGELTVISHGLDWLLTQADLSSQDDYRDLLSALILFSELQYGMHHEEYENKYEPPEEFNVFDAICSILRLYGIDFTSDVTEEKLTIYLSDNLYYELHKDGNRIDSIDLYLPHIIDQNGYPVQISVSGFDIKYRDPPKENEVDDDNMTLLETIEALWNIYH